MTTRNFKINNFDLIRLFAALQVAFIHTKTHLSIDSSSTLFNTLIFLLDLFPGVPIFFFVSGYLISKSYEHSSNLKEYTRNRTFRIFPALILCNIIAVTFVYFTGYFNTIDFRWSEFLIWFTSQSSILQFYNPDFMREFGVGVLNGSLWTISVELQFYILIPILYLAFSVFGKLFKTNTMLIFLILIFMCINMVYNHYRGIHENLFILKLIGVSFLPWFYMFLIGVFFQKNFNTFHKYFVNKAIYLLPLYIIITYISKHILGFTTGNTINPINFILLSILIFSVSYSFQKLSDNLLNKNDISYGVYIYHMLFVNLFVFYEYTNNVSFVFMVISLTILSGILSWIVVEKPILKSKKESIHKIK
jgi:peptidoglycan/LPS O-acetylase OafA/YrhL